MQEGMFAAFNFQISQHSPCDAPQDFGCKTCLKIALQESLLFLYLFSLKLQ